MNIQRGVFDLVKVQKEIDNLEKKSQKPDFWKDHRKAQEIMQRKNQLIEYLQKWENLQKECKELIDLTKLALDEKETGIASELQKRKENLQKKFKKLEIDALLNEEYDRNNALLTIHASTGGVEACDWAEILLRMYLRFAQKKEFKASVLEITPGEEAGIKNVTIEILGPFAFGYFKGEAGVHRLVRLSPFDADHLRHTSFALVEVIPEIEEEIKIEISPEDLKIETFRASSAGGQYVNTTDSAVRITHLASGITASCQNERSQRQNKDTALKILKSRLYEKELEKKRKKEAKLKGEYARIGWGSQIRSYILHPYKMVSDHRTKVKTSDTDKVLGGDLDKFVENWLRWHKKSKS